MEDNNDVIYGGNSTGETKEETKDETSTEVVNETSTESTKETKTAPNDSWWENVDEPKQTDVCGIVSLIVSIISIPCSCCGCVFLAPVLFIAGIILAIVSKKQRGKFSGLALAGLIISIVAVLFFVVVLGCQAYLKNLLEQNGYTMDDLSKDPNIINDIIKK